MNNLEIYPFDPTGALSSNLITTEEHTVEEINYRDFYMLVPKLAPFFLNNLVLKYSDNVNPTRTLIQGQDYSPVLPYLGATTSIGKPVYGGIYMLGTINTGTVSIQYQTLGGVWAASSKSILKTMMQEMYNPRTAVYDDIVNLPTCFPPMNHTENIDNIYGMDKLVNYINNLSTIAASKPQTVVTFNIT